VSHRNEDCPEKDYDDAAVENAVGGNTYQSKLVPMLHKLVTHTLKGYVGDTFGLHAKSMRIQLKINQLACIFPGQRLRWLLWTSKRRLSIFSQFFHFN